MATKFLVTFKNKLGLHVWGQLAFGSAILLGCSHYWGMAGDQRILGWALLGQPPPLHVSLTFRRANRDIVSWLWQRHEKVQIHKPIKKGKFQL